MIIMDGDEGEEGATTPDSDLLNQKRIARLIILENATVLNETMRWKKR